MVFEYMVHGDLADLLRRNDPAMRSSDRDITLEKVRICKSRFKRIYDEVYEKQHLNRKGVEI